MSHALNNWSTRLQRGILPIYQKVLITEAQEPWLELLTTLATPLTYFLAFGLGLRGYVADVEGHPYFVFLAPGLISLTILLQAFSTSGWSLWLDCWFQEMIDEYRIKSISTSDIIMGEMLGGFTVGLIKGLIVAITLMVLIPLEISPMQFLIYILFMLPGSILFGCLGALSGTLFTKPSYISNVQVVFITPLLYLGGLFFPISVFPNWLKPIVSWLPTTALFDGGRAVFLTGHFSWRYYIITWVSAIICFVVTVKLFNKKLSD